MEGNRKNLGLAPTHRIDARKSSHSTCISFNGLLCRNTCAAISTELVKYILLQRDQVPERFDLMKNSLTQPLKFHNQNNHPPMQDPHTQKQLLQRRTHRLQWNQTLKCSHRQLRQSPLPLSDRGPVSCETSGSCLFASHSQSQMETCPSGSNTTNFDNNLAQPTSTNGTVLIKNSNTDGDSCNLINDIDNSGVIGTINPKPSTVSVGLPVPALQRKTDYCIYSPSSQDCITLADAENWCNTSADDDRLPLQRLALAARTDKMKPVSVVVCSM